MGAYPHNKNNGGYKAYPGENNRCDEGSQYCRNKKNYLSDEKFLPGAAQYPQFYWPDYPPSVPERNGGNAAINNQKRPDAPALQNAAQSRQTANPARGTCSLLLSINPPLN